MNRLKKWMLAATKQQKIALADMAGTTLPMLRQFAGAYRHKDRGVSMRSGLAIRMEQAAAALHRIDDTLPEMLRTDLSPECRGCDFARKCLGDRVDESGFEAIPVVES